MTILKLALQGYTSSFRGLSRDIWILALVMLVNRVGAMVLPFMTIYLTSSLHFSLSQAGFVMGAYGAGSIAGSYLGGQLTDKFNYYSVQLWSLVGSALLLFVFPILTEFWTITLCILFFSFVSDMLRPANSVAIAAYAKDENRVRSFSLMRLSINLGFAVGPAIGGLIAGTIGYTWIFIFDGVTCLLAAVLILSKLKYKPPKKVQEYDNEQVPVAPLSAYKDKKYLFFISMVMLYGILFFQLFTSVPVFMKNISGYDEFSIGLFMALNGLLIVLIEMPLIQRLEKKPNVFSFITYGFILISLSFIILLLNPMNILFSLAFIFFITTSEMFAMPFMLNFAVNRSSIGRQGQYMALYAMGYGMAHIIAPTVSMYIADSFGFQSLYIGVSILALIGGYTFYKLIKAGYW
ncbi:MAG: MFS transporter [Saprospiraceae bacterium]